MANIHIPYDQKQQPYHKVVADLVCTYARQGGFVLDIGCGVGHTLLEVSKNRPDLHLGAADVDENCLEITDQKVGLERKIIIHDIEDLRRMQITVDAIIMSHSLEHMLRPADVVRDVLELLSPDGVLVLAVPNPVRMQVVIANILKRHYVNRGHVYAWDRSHWMNFLENIMKLQVIRYAEDYFPLPFARKLRFITPLEVFLARVFPWFSFSNIAVVKKSRAQ